MVHARCRHILLDEGEQALSRGNARHGIAPLCEALELVCQRLELLEVGVQEARHALCGGRAGDLDAVDDDLVELVCWDTRLHEGLAVCVVAARRDHSSSLSSSRQLSRRLISGKAAFIAL